MYKAESVAFLVYKNLAWLLELGRACQPVSTHHMSHGPGRPPPLTPAILRPALAHLATLRPALGDSQPGLAQLATVRPVLGIVVLAWPS